MIIETLTAFTAGRFVWNSRRIIMETNEGQPTETVAESNGLYLPESTVTVEK